MEKNHTKKTMAGLLYLILVSISGKLNSANHFARPRQVHLYVPEDPSRTPIDERGPRLIELQEQASRGAAPDAVLASIESLQAQIAQDEPRIAEFRKGIEGHWGRGANITVIGELIARAFQHDQEERNYAAEALRRFTQEKRVECQNQLARQTAQVEALQECLDRVESEVNDGNISNFATLQGHVGQFVDGTPELRDLAGRIYLDIMDALTDLDRQIADINVRFRRLEERIRRDIFDASNHIQVYHDRLANMTMHFQFHLHQTGDILEAIRHFSDSIVYLLQIEERTGIIINPAYSLYYRDQLPILQNSFAFFQGIWNVLHEIENTRNLVALFQGNARPPIVRNVPGQVVDLIEELSDYIDNVNNIQGPAIQELININTNLRNLARTAGSNPGPLFGDAGQALLVESQDKTENFSEVKTREIRDLRAELDNVMAERDDDQALLDLCREMEGLGTDIAAGATVFQNIPDTRTFGITDIGRLKDLLEKGKTLSQQFSRLRELCGNATALARGMGYGYEAAFAGKEDQIKDASTKINDLIVEGKARLRELNAEYESRSRVNKVLNKHILELQSNESTQSMFDLKRLSGKIFGPGLQLMKDLSTGTGNSMNAHEVLKKAFGGENPVYSKDSIREVLKEFNKIGDKIITFEKLLIALIERHLSPKSAFGSSVSPQPRLPKGFQAPTDPIEIMNQGGRIEKDQESKQRKGDITFMSPTGIGSRKRTPSTDAGIKRTEVKLPVQQKQGKYARRDRDSSRPNTPMRRYN